MDIGMNIEFKAKLTPKGDKSLYRKNLPMPIHLKRDLIVQLVLMHKLGSLQFYPSQSTQAPFLHRENPTEKYVSLWISGKSTL